MDALLPLGPAPRPTTDDDLAARLRASLAALAGSRVQGLDGATVTPVLDGADLTSLDVDLTGVAVGLPTGQQSPPAHWRPAVETREPGTLRTLRIDAHPLTAVDLPVDVTAELAGLTFAWVTGDDAQAGVELVEPTADTPVTGSARVAVSRAGLAGAVQGMLAVALQSNGIQLTSFDLDVTQEGPRGAALKASAGIRKGMFLSATITATASAAVDDAMVLTVGDVHLHSGNPLVAAMLGAFRGKIEAATGQRVDLAASLPPGVHLRDVSLDVGDDVVLTAHLG
ncbi:hypothetical protein ATJ88_1385 [Isoptericola jiangsuensis]|uniref:Uncharacterized protein n=1 Tax=Isoptericola jiangsuensis TaxID=548579 RepID=A0A2A9EWU8_9MICO|nr:hypothetical protein [Isoptericola jiangsuensis]PFG42715.1 hypothetical protein ATJ88_1385 [Isoptericola jiangsuensis]